MEASGDPDRALRAYNDAIGLDSTCGDAYLRLGAIREGRRDYREAERVYSLATEHVPTLREAYVRRAAVRLLLGREAEGVAELRALSEVDPETDEATHAAVDALRKLDEWFVAHDFVAARLGVWRRMGVLAVRIGDSTLASKAHSMTRALTLVVGAGDPVTSPSSRVGLRLLIAHASR